MSANQTPTDRQAFETLVLRHQGQVCAIAFSVLRDRARSEEVAQDAFLIAWRDRTAVAPTAGWICGIARNLARNAARRRTERPMVDDPATETRDARGELIAREETARAAAALATLPGKYRDAIVLYYRGEESFADVAGALGITEASARQRVHRGRARLRDLLAPVEATLKATRPTTAFTAACVAAWSIGKVPSAAAATGAPSTSVAASATGAAAAWLTPAIGIGGLALAAVIGIATGSPGSGDASSGSRVATPSRASDGARVAANDPRAALTRRFPAPRRPHRGALPPGVFAIEQPGVANQGSGTAGGAVPDDTTLELDFKLAPVNDLVRLVSDRLDTPVLLGYHPELDAIDIKGKLQPLEILDEICADIGADRVEVAAIKIVPAGRTDAATLGGQLVSLDVRAMPMNRVLTMLEPKLAMPIQRAVPEVPAGVRDMNGEPVIDPSPPITLSLHDVPAGAALQMALEQAHQGYELTTGLMLVPEQP